MIAHAIDHTLLAEIYEGNRSSLQSSVYALLCPEIAMRLSCSCFLLTIFSSQLTRCFRAAYSDHCASKHATLGGRKQLSSSSATCESGLPSIENDSFDTNMSDMKGQLSSVPSIADDDDWVANCVEKEYIPVLEDVGCVLKVHRS